jgi:alpha-D-ribose 1-methylphosphonate 5-triphosphate synthase subunit PhnH
MQTSTHTVLPAFENSVHDSQAVFRSALSALSEPGTVHQASAGAGLGMFSPAAYALCLALLDEQTALWISPALSTESLRRALVFHCGCPLVDHPSEAAFAVVDGASLADLSQFNPGTDRDPHLSCTVLVQLDQLEGGAARSWQGPGIAGSLAMHIPLAQPFWQQRRQISFPRGVDVLFVAGNQFVGLPRSTRVQSVSQEGC